jgi:effector-binding domain-containing protein
MSEPTIELREPQPYLGIHAPSIDGIRQFADSTFPELFGWLSEHGVEPAGPPFIRYYEIDHAGQPLDVEVGVPVDGAPEGDARVRADALPAGSYLTFLHVGPYTSDSLPDLANGRAELLAWAEENGIEYGQETHDGQSFPCAFEQYRIGPVDDSDFTKWETEFAYLVL